VWPLQRNSNPERWYSGLTDKEKIMKLNQKIESIRQDKERAAFREWERDTAMFYCSCCDEEYELEEDRERCPVCCGELEEIE